MAERLGAVFQDLGGRGGNFRADAVARKHNNFFVDAGHA